MFLFIWKEALNNKIIKERFIGKVNATQVTEISIESQLKSVSVEEDLIVDGIESTPKEEESEHLQMLGVVKSWHL